MIEALRRGEDDHTTTAEVYVMLYFTPAYRSAVSDPVFHIRRQVAFANRVMSENEIPVELRIYCIEELIGFVESPDDVKRILDFCKARKNLLNTADMAILMTGTPAEKCAGLANSGPCLKNGSRQRWIDILAGMLVDLGNQATNRMQKIWLTSKLWLLDFQIVLVRAGCSLEK